LGIGVSCFRNFWRWLSDGAGCASARPKRAAHQLLILRSLLPAWLLRLLHHLRADWLDGDDSSGRWSTLDAGGVVPAGRLLLVPSCESKSGFVAGILGFDVSV